MQIEVYQPTNGQPLPPIQWNYEELKSQLTQALEAYKGRVYTDSDITAAKSDRASLNKLADAIDNKRKEMKALYLAPYAEFEEQAKSLTALVKAQSSEIDNQVKAYDEACKAAKLDKIKSELYAPMIGDLAELIPYERLHNPKWLNITANMKGIGSEMQQMIVNIAAGLSSIDVLSLDDDLAAQVKAAFLKDFNLAAAIAEKERIERRREELARYQAAQTAKKTPEPIDVPYTPVLPKEPEPVAAEKIFTVAFRIHATNSQLRELSAFMTKIGIKPERITEGSI